MGEVRSAKALRSGALLVRSIDQDQSQKLLNITSLCNIEVQSNLADRLNQVDGVIRSEALTMLSNADLLEELSPQGVVRVERLRSRNAAWGPNPTIKVSFRNSLPQHLYCGYLRVPVDPWIPAPRQCSNCWSHTHPTNRCRRTNPRCANCGVNGHRDEDCAAQTWCFLCDQGHKASDPQCPVLKFEKSCAFVAATPRIGLPLRS